MLTLGSRSAARPSLCKRPTVVACAITARLVCELLPLRLEVLQGQTLQSDTTTAGCWGAGLGPAKAPARGETSCYQWQYCLSKDLKPEKAADSLVMSTELPHPASLLVDSSAEQACSVASKE